MPHDPAPLTLLQADTQRRLRRMRRLASMMDTAFRIPGTPVRVGWDSIIGLLPVGGDAITLASGAYLFLQARKLGVPPRTQARMLVNTALDFAVGSIPLVGDLFDVAWKANRRNVRLVEEALEQQHGALAPGPRVGGRARKSA